MQMYFFIYIYIYINKSKYNFYLLRDLTKCTPHKTYFLFFWKWEFVFGDFDKKTEYFNIRLAFYKVSLPPQY
jgi:hypothetical protein